MILKKNIDHIHIIVEMYKSSNPGLYDLSYKINQSKFVSIRKEDTNIQKKYKLKKLLGEGLTGKVYLAVEKDNPSNIIAIKEEVIPRNDRVDRINMVKNEISILTELTALSKNTLCHISKLIDVCYRGKEEIFFLVLELIDGIDIDIYAIENTLSEDEYMVEICVLFFEIVATLNVIHKQGIIHRDIKTNNIIYDKINKRLVIIDFGVSCRVGEGNNILNPNLFTDPLLEESKSNEIDIWVDIYGLGVVFYIVLLKKEYITTVLKKPEFLQKYANATNELSKLAEKYDVKSSRNVMIQAIIKMLTPYNKDDRPSLTSIIKSYEEKDPTLLSHFN